MAATIRSPQEVCQNFEKLAPSAGWTAWTMYVVEDVVILNKATATYNNIGVLYYEIPKVLVESVTVSLGNLSQLAPGAKVYFDATNSVVTDISSGNTLCGIVTETPAVGDTKIEIHLMGALAL